MDYFPITLRSYFGYQQSRILSYCVRDIYFGYTIIHSVIFQNVCYITSNEFVPSHPTRLARMFTIHSYPLNQNFFYLWYRQWWLTQNDSVNLFTKYSTKQIMVSHIMNKSRIHQVWYWIQNHWLSLNLLSINRLSKSGQVCHSGLNAKLDLIRA